MKKLFVLTILLAFVIVLPAIAAETSHNSNNPASKYFSINELDEMGGPDNFGYEFIDSQEEGGPVYDWIDISETGTELVLENNDLSDLITLPFTFLMYTNNYEEVRISSEGYIIFDMEFESFSNIQIPSPIFPNNAIYLFWDNLAPANGGSVYYGEDENGNWICQYNEVEEHGGDGTITAQIILYPNGEFILQYQSLANGIDIDGETIGIENADGTDGLQVSYNDEPVDYPFDELAIHFSPGEEDASVSGFVTDLETGDPVEGAEVVYMGPGTYMGITDGTGYYEIDPMRSGTFSVQIDGEGFATYTEGDIVIEDGENLYDFELLYDAALTWDPAEFNFELNEGQLDSAVLSLSNIGGVDLFWTLEAYEVEEEVLDRQGGAFVENNGPRQIPLILSAELHLRSRFSAEQEENPPGNELDEPYFLVIQDDDPWGGNTTHTDYLDLMDIPYDDIGSGDMDDWDFDPYTVIMIPSCQSQAFYNTFENNHDRFEEWVDDGGWLEFHGCTQGAIWEMWDGLEYVHMSSGTNYVVEFDHPITDGIPEEFTGNSANHGYMINLPDNALTLIVDPTDNPVVIEYEYGRGNMIVTTETWEWGDDHDQVAGDVMHNAIDYAALNAGSLSWLYVDVEEGMIVPGDEFDVNVYCNATDIEPGVYEAYLELLTNDPQNDIVEIPVTLTVAGAVPPAAFNLLTPEDGSVFNVADIELTWEEAVDPEPEDVVVYDVYISDDPDDLGDPVATDLADEMYTYTSPGEDVYYWTIHARDTNTDGVWANQTWSFEVDYNPPEAFNLLAPGDGTVFEEETEIQLSWEATTDPDPGDEIVMDVYISTDPDNLGEPVATDLMNTNYTYTVIEQTVYYWTIHARDTNTNGTWANQTWSFEYAVPEPASDFVLLEPEDGSVVPFADPYEVTFAWQSSVDPDPGEDVTYNLELTVTVDEQDPPEMYSYQDLADTTITLNLPEVAGFEYWQSFEVEWTVNAMSPDSDVPCEAPFTFSLEPVSGVTDRLFSGIPTEYDIAAAYPNPFNNAVQVVVAVPRESNISVEIFDVLGRNAAVLENSKLEPGYHYLNWQATGTSGVYFLVVSSDTGWSKISKLVYMK